MDANTSDAFDRAFASLLQAERSHRQSLEQRLAGAQALLVETVMTLAPTLLDERLSADPRYLHDLDDAGWRALVLEARRRGTRQRNRFGDRRLTAENQTLRQELATLRAQHAAQQQRILDLETELAHLIRKSAPSPPAQPSSTPPDVILPGQLRLPDLPKDPPAALAKHFPGNLWARGSLFLAILARSGWSHQRASLDELAKLVGVSPGAGSLKRLLLRLDKQGLVHKETVPVAPSRVAIVWPSDLGRQVAEALGIPAVESEWERLLRLHGGERQQGHSALVCLFAYHARRFGHSTQVCPHVDGPAEPDILLTRDDESIFVEVEAESGSVERRMKKWRNQAALQGYVALCAPTPEVRKRLAVEAHAASKQGLATDLAYLRKAEEDVWVQKW